MDIVFCILALFGIEGAASLVDAISFLIFRGRHSLMSARHHCLPLPHDFHVLTGSLAGNERLLDHLAFRHFRIGHSTGSCTALTCHIYPGARLDDGAIASGTFAWPTYIPKS